MTSPTTMVTEFTVVDGVNVATRSVGSGPRLVLLHRFRGTLDDWDPAFVSALAADHEVFMFDSLGVGQTGGVAPADVEGMANFAISLPVAITVFPEDVYKPPETWARRAYKNLIYFHEVDKGGHFAAWEQPQLFSEELRTAFRSLRGNAATTAGTH